MTHWLHQLVIAQAEPAGGGFGMLIPLVLMFGIMYFLIIRPQQKKQKEVQTFLSALRVGDKVVTQGGILGEITRVEAEVVTLDLGNKVTISVLRSHIASGQPSASAAPSEEKK
jgi:preprotein translocase subunit YajC